MQAHVVTLGHRISFGLINSTHDLHSKGPGFDSLVGELGQKSIPNKINSVCFQDMRETSITETDT